MVRRLLLVALLFALAAMMGAGPAYWDQGYGGKGGYVGGGMGQDVDLETLGDDIIAGVNWTPSIDFSAGTKYYFDVNAAEGGDGSIDDPFMGFGAELFLDNHIERWDHNGTNTNAANSPVIGAGDVCVLRGGNHGKFQINDMHFTDYIGIVGMPGERVIFDYVRIMTGQFFYFEGIEANSANTRNSGFWPAAYEHTANDYTDYDDGPWFVSVRRDTSSNYTTKNIVFNNCKIGISSGNLPALWDHEEWNSNTVGGFDIIRAPFVQVQNCYGVGLSHAFNVANNFIASGGGPDSTVTVNCNNIFNNDFRYMNGDGVYINHAQYTEVTGNTFIDFYVSNDDHVVAIDAYLEAANNIFDSNKLINQTTRRPNVMLDYIAEGCPGDPPSCGGRGGTCINLIGGNTNNIVRNNVIHGNSYGILQVRSLWGSSYNVQLVNNTITCDSLQSWDADSGQSALIRTDATTNTVPGDPADGDTVQVFMANNICSEISAGTAGAGDQNSTIESTNSEYAFDFTGAGFTSWAPEANPLLQDVSLAFGSENIDAGTGSPWVQDDFSGDCRYKGAIHDIGAYEYDDGGACPADDNILGDSWDLTNTDCWNPDLTKLSYTFGQPGLFDSNAVLVEYLGDQWASFSQAPYFDLTGGTVVLSVYVKNDDTSSGQTLKLSLYDNDDSTDHYMRFRYPTGDVPTYYDDSGIDDYGIENFGDNWYRLWIMVDLRTRVLIGNEFRIRFNPCEGTTVIGEGIFHNGSQVEYDVIYPGNYTKTTCP